MKTPIIFNEPSFLFSVLDYLTIHEEKLVLESGHDYCFIHHINKNSDDETDGVEIIIAELDLPDHTDDSVEFALMEMCQEGYIEHGDHVVSATVIERVDTNSVRVRIIPTDKLAIVEFISPVTVLYGSSVN